MDIYIKTFNSASENPGSFSLSTDIGSITPSTASLNELLDGKIFSLSDENATQVILSVQGFQPKTVNINKSEHSCFQASAVNFLEGNTRPTNSDGTKAPFRTSTIPAISLENIFNLNVGEKFTLQIFNESIEFTIFRIDPYSANEIKIEASKQVGEIYSILQLFKNTATGKISFIYKDVLNTGLIQYSSETSKIEEWAPRENFPICSAAPRQN
jgi:hypothetical protein